MKFQKFLRLTACCLALSCGATTSFGQQATRIVVGFAPGGPTDAVARLVAKHLSEEFKSPFVVDNKAGAAGDIATAEVIKAAPDGHTALVASVNIPINPSMTEGIKYDAKTQLKAVKAVATAPTVLVVRNDFPAQNYAEFLAVVRKRPGELNSAAPGASPLLATELFNQLTKTSITPVPYKGAAPAMVDLVAGHVDMSFATLGSVLPHIKAGKVRAIAIAASTRDAQLPDVPTFDESGLSDFRFDAWVGMFVPAKTPDAVVEKLNASLDQLVASKDYAAQLATAGMTPLSNSSPKAFAKIIDQETDLYARLGKAVKDKAVVPAK